MVDYTLKCTSEKFQNDTHAYCMRHAQRCQRISTKIGLLVYIFGWKFVYLDSFMYWKRWYKKYSGLAPPSGQNCHWGLFEVISVKLIRVCWWRHYYVFFHIENLKRNDLNLPNTVTKNWNQNNAELRILAYVAKESFHDICFYLNESSVIICYESKIHYLKTC